ncbi:MAG: hypothetical protein R6U39_10945, partial [Candidatus Aegiribacteria sp.]
EFYSSLSQLQGTSADMPQGQHPDTGIEYVNSGVNSVEIKLVDQTSDPQKAWTASGWSTTTFQYVEVTGGTTEWYYTTEINWDSGPNNGQH